jgi:hypothetical protein
MPTMAPFRACSTFIVKSLDDDDRIIEGVASSSAPDLAGDIIESRGAVYTLPMPLLMQHDRDRPVGDVIVAKVAHDHITIRAQLKKDTGLAYVEDAWKQLRSGLVKGLSIGAQPLKADPILDKAGKMTGVRYTAWRWLELSAVTMPMNIDSTIDVVRAFDPWGAAAFAVSHDPQAGLADGLDRDPGYEATRARAMDAQQAARRALYRRDSP